MIYLGGLSQLWLLTRQDLGTVIMQSVVPFLPGEWSMFFPTAVDIGIFIGSLGIFTTLFLLFMRVAPFFAMAELKAVMPQASPHDHGSGGHDSHGKGGH